ncbi:MAG: hypothetical protein DPW09_14255 [Anaerolineae bacterium]|nr:DUF2723 domain-containing protein [Anaerolineales bacterium]MCQ3974600.1 hypothetical protein [Anaerolineae bacterium]
MVSKLASAGRADSQSLDRFVGLGVTLAAFLLYLSTLAPTVLEADGGEFQFVPWLPGIAHPTGYPLYVLLGWLWTHLLPLGEVAWRMNLFSAVLAALAVGLTYAVARQWIDHTLPGVPFPARVLAAAVSAASFAASHTFWSQAIVAEVYALHTLFVAAILWLAVQTLKVLKTFRVSPGRLLALTIGLSLTHHRTVVLLLPALALFLWTGDRRRETGVEIPPGPRSPVPGRNWLIYTALLLTPLLLYLYLPIIAPFTPYDTLSLSETQTLTLYDNSLRGFWNHIMGSVFTGELQPAAAGLDRLALTWQLLRQQVGWVGATLALLGLITLWQRGRTDLLLLSGLSFVFFLAFNLIYFIGDVYVLFIPNWLLLCLWLGLGWLGLVDGITRAFVQGKTGSVNSSPGLEALEKRLGQRIYHFMVIALAGLGLLFPLVLLVTRFGEINQANNITARDRWQTILAEPMPSGAVLLSNDRNEIMPMWYYQYVEGRRPDLLGLFPLITSEPDYANIGRILDQALASGRPVYLIKPMAGLEIKADLAPAGALWQARPYQTPPAYPLDLVLPSINLRGYDLSPALISPGRPITVTLHWQATEPLERDYSSYVHLIDGAGQGLSQSDQRPGGDFYPSRYWQPGETLRDRHVLTVPPIASPGEYRLRVGLYYQPEPGVIENLGQGLEIGSLTLEPVISNQ